MDYEITREYVRNMEAFKECELKDTPAEKMLVEHVQKHGTITGEYLNSLIRSVALSLSKADHQQLTHQPIVPELSPDILTTSAFLADKIAPWVEMVRSEIFGSAQPPFPTIKEAALYLEKVGKKEEKSRAEVDFEKYREHIVPLIEVYKGHPPVPIWAGVLKYIKENGQLGFLTYSYPIPQDWLVPQMRQSAQDFPVLSWLGNEVRIMARATGFHEIALVAYILCGIKPILQRWELTTRVQYQRLPSGEELHPASLYLEIKTRDITFKELREIYQSIRIGMKAKRTDALNERHWWLYQTVKEKGGPKKKGEKGAVDFWESIRQAADDQGFVTWRSWRAVRVAYHRLIKRLESAHSSTLPP